MKSNSLSNQQIRDSLQGFLEGTLRLEALKQALSDKVKIDFFITEGFREVHYLKPGWDFEITVTPTHVQSALERYLRGEIDAIELSDWAAIIFALDPYHPFDPQHPEGDPETRPFSKIIGELLTPQEDPITPETVRRYLEWMNSDQG